ncbi:MAG: TIGR03747 family integrating conjugative element membrane protein [Woeseiaceae bacterium]
MTTRPAPQNEKARTVERRGLIAGTLGRIAKTLRWLLLSLLVSVLIEWIGMVFWWPEAGLQHSQRMLEREMDYLNRDFRRSVVSSDPVRFARRFRQRSHYLLFELTGAQALASRLQRANFSDTQGWPPTLHRWYEPVSRYLTAAMQIVQVYSVRLAILCLAMPLFLLFCLIGVVDGLVQRDLRRWGGGRESSYLYHYAKRSSGSFVIGAWVIYLALPFSVHPVFIVLPFAVLFAISVSIAATTFKKYL